MNNHTYNSFLNGGFNVLEFRKESRRYQRWATYQQKMESYLKQFKNHLEKGSNIGTDVISDILYTQPGSIFYIIPQTRELRCFHDSPGKNISLSYFAKLLRDRGYVFNDSEAKTLYSILKNLLTNLEKIQIYGSLFDQYYHKYLHHLRKHNIEPQHSDNKTIFHDPQSHFIMINGIICFKDNNFGMLPMTCKNFDKMLKQHDYPSMSSKLKRRILYALKHRYTLYTYDDCDDINKLFDIEGESVFYSEGNIYHDPLVCNVNQSRRLPMSFVTGNCNLDNNTLSAINYIINGKKKNLEILARLVASAFIAPYILKRAVVIIANDSNYNYIKEFVNALFGKNFINESFRYVAWLSEYQYLNVESSYSDILTFNFLCYPILAIEGKELPEHYKGIRKLVKSTYIEHSDKYSKAFKFRNKVPLLVMTTNKEYARIFSLNVNSEIIDLSKMPNPVNTLMMNDFRLLRQTLALYGLRVSMEQPKKARPTAKPGKSPEVAAREFVDMCCKYRDGAFTVKSEIREAFTKYLSLHSPKSEHLSLVVCRYLNELGYDDRHKKRVEKGGNPVAIILNLDFDKEMFYNYFNAMTQTDTAIQDMNKIKETFNLRSELSKAVIYPYI